MFNKDIDTLKLYYYKKQSKSILKKSKLKKIASKKELIILIREHYENIDYLELEKATLQDDIEGIRENTLLSKSIGLFTLIFTLMMFILSIINTQIDQKNIMRENKIAALDSRKEDYYAKTLELENKMKFSKDQIEKEQLQDYISILKNEYNRMLQLKGLENENIKFNDVFNLYNGIKLLCYSIGTLYISILIEEFNNYRGSMKKTYLIMKLNIINSILNSE